jgi:hypothetical protein
MKYVIMNVFYFLTILFVLALSLEYAFSFKGLDIVLFFYVVLIVAAVYLVAESVNIHS